MRIDDAIKELRRLKKAGATSVLIAWWTPEDFSATDYGDWDVASEYAERRMDWSDTHDALADLLTLSEEV